MPIVRLGLASVTSWFGHLEAQTPGPRGSAAIVRMLRAFDMNRASHFERVDITALEVVLGGEAGTHIQVEGIQVQPQETGNMSVAVGRVRLPTRGSA
ncbi:MAG: hypothetical protein AB8H86_02750 [Polyangiales bacterium]